MWVYLLRREVVYPPRARALTTDLRSGTFNPGKGCCTETGSVHGGITERQAEGGIWRKYLAESGGMPRRSTNFILRPAKCFSRPGAIFDIFSQQSVVPPNMTVYACYTVMTDQCGTTYVLNSYQEGPQP